MSVGSPPIGELFAAVACGRTVGPDGRCSRTVELLRPTRELVEFLRADAARVATLRDQHAGCTWRTREELAKVGQGASCRCAIGVPGDAGLPDFPAAGRLANAKNVLILITCFEGIAR
jgi:hypothetical protein